MISVSFKKDKNELEVGANGHALFDKKGRDIVCASVSVLIQSWCLSEKELCRADIDIVRDYGSIRAKIKNYDQDELLLYKSLLLNLKALERQYPRNIKINAEELNGRF
jgi:hypothetical protein